MAKVKSAFPYFGGKHRISGYLNSLIPEHHTYVEVFGGAASLLMTKHRSKVEIYNDIDSNVVNFFLLLQDDKAFERFKKRCSLTPFSREMFYDFRDTWHKLSGEEKVYQWYVIQYWSFAGIHGGSWGYSLKKNRAEHWKKAIDRLDEIVDRLRYVQIENNTWEKILKAYDSTTTLFYLDPPYLPSTRKSGVYENELSESEHQDLINTIQNLKGKVMLSGYNNDLYNTLAWNRLDIDTTCDAIGKTNTTNIKGDGSLVGKSERVESVWLNYESQPTLF